MNKTREFKAGDVVERVLSHEECRRLEKRDIMKAKELKLEVFMGRAAVYMHADEGYVVLSVAANGGLKLRGFCALVSPNDVQCSTQPVYR